MAATSRFRSGNVEMKSSLKGQAGRDEMIGEFDRWMRNGEGCCAKVIFRGVVIMAGRSFQSKVCRCEQAVASNKTAPKNITNNGKHKQTS